MSCFDQVKRMKYVRPFDPWKSPLCTCPFKYTLNVYTGCDHACVYCYITAYIREPFRARPKKDLFRTLFKDLEEVDKKSFIALSYSSDPYPRIDEKYGHTRRVLEILNRKGVRYLILTKGSSFLRDLDVISKGKCALGITVTTIDEDKAKALEPNAPSPKERIRALKKAKELGIPVYARIDPIIPFYTEEDLEETIKELSFVFHITFSTLKMRPDIFARMRAKFPELMKKLGPLYKTKMAGYYYLPKKLRFEILEKAKDIVHSYGISFGSCREAYLSEGSCDGSHLIPERKIKSEDDLK